MKRSEIEAAARGEGAEDYCESFISGARWALAQVREFGDRISEDCLKGRNNGIFFCELDDFCRVEEHE